MLAACEALINNGNVKDARLHQLEFRVALLREELRINGLTFEGISHVASNLLLRAADFLS